MKWIKATENWETDLQGKHLRFADTKLPCPYRNVNKSTSFGNKWLRCWNSETDIKSRPAEFIEYLDESPSAEVKEQQGMDIEKGGVIAVGILEKINPKLTEQEQAIFIAGFQECIKWLNNQ